MGHLIEETNVHFYVPDNATMLMDMENTGGKLAHKSNKIAEASAAATLRVNVNEKEQAEATSIKRNQ